MGMFNEVYCKCPRCGRTGYMQISQVVLGFGNFHVDQPSTLEDLDDDQLATLRDRVARSNFVCESDPLTQTESVFSNGFPVNDGCGHVFNPITGRGYDDGRRYERARAAFPYAYDDED